MKLTWTSPDQIPGIQRWGVLPLFFAGAGAVAGAAGNLLSKWLPFVEDQPFTAPEWAAVEAGTGLAIGNSVLLCRSSWIGILGSPILSVATFQMVAFLWRSGMGDFSPLPVLDLLSKHDAMGPVLFHAPFLVGANRVLLKVGSIAHLGWVGPAIYAVLGLVSGLFVGFYEWSMGDPRDLPPHLSASILAGGLGGILQFVAMFAAQSFSGLGQREEGEAA